MLEKNDPATVTLDNIVFRTNLPLPVPVNKCCIFFHGWNGSENSMQLFFSDLPENMGYFAPRAFFPTREGGYTWAGSLIEFNAIQENKRSPLDELLGSVRQINTKLAVWFKYFNINQF